MNDENEELKQPHFDVQEPDEVSEELQLKQSVDLQSQGVSHSTTHRQDQSREHGTPVSGSVSGLRSLKSQSNISFNLKDYNHQRFKASMINNVHVMSHHHKPSQSSISQHAQSQVNTSKGDDENELEEISVDQSSSKDQVSSHIQVSKHFGNITVSLFWEEKIVMIVRFMQLYGYLMLFGYEVWPYQARIVWSPLFFFFLGAFQFMLGPDQYYSLIQSVDATLINLCCYMFTLLLVTSATLLSLMHWRLHHRLLNSKKLNIPRYWFWFLEVSYLPLLLNVIQYSTCNYHSNNESIQEAQCQESNSRVFMIACAIVAMGIGAGYNVGLGLHLRNEQVSTLLHEEYVVKKEIEYTVGISDMWNSRYFYTFSSFKGELTKMYHRVIFNSMELILILVHAVMTESQAKFGIVAALLACLAFYTMAARPYRCSYSNILLFMLTCVLLVTTFLLMLKKGELKSALFVENYFYGLLIIVNTFGWVLIVAFLILILLTKRKWPVTKETVLKAIAGQDMAILYIKKARKLSKKIVKTKIYTEKEQRQVQYLIKVLEAQFNQFRDQQPVIMDSLIETLDYLKQMKKNYEENPYLFNYDYREELRSLVKARYRVFDVKPM